MSLPASNDNPEPKKPEVCKEYNTLKYKTMIMTGKNMDTQIINETSEEMLHDFLMMESSNNKKQQWNKLSKTFKIKKLQEYVNITLKEEHQLTSEECGQTMVYVKKLLERKKLTKNSEIDYNEETGVIESVHCIVFQNVHRKFTLNKDMKNTSKKSKTVKKKTAKANKIENEIK
tara:strand:+ start:1347 stop:1868 length:522 start_codon:yes stop_codon:yes gene_type:complete